MPHMPQSKASLLAFYFSTSNLGSSAPDAAIQRTVRSQAQYWGSPEEIEHTMWGQQRWTACSMCMWSCEGWESPTLWPHLTGGMFQRHISRLVHFLQPWHCHFMPHLWLRPWQIGPLHTARLKTYPSGFLMSSRGFRSPGCRPGSHGQGRPAIYKGCFKSPSITSLHPGSTFCRCCLLTEQS